MPVYEAPVQDVLFLLYDVFRIDRFANLNTTVIGDYDHPSTRLPGGGGAPEIAVHAKQTLVVLKQSPRSFVKELSFRTSAGFLAGSGSRARAGAPGAGPTTVITDLGLLRPAQPSEELELVSRYDGTSVETIVQSTGWPLRIAERVDVLAPPTDDELQTLRDLQRRTRVAHAQRVAPGARGP